jgi:hypothetical protein
MQYSSACFSGVTTKNGFWDNGPNLLRLQILLVSTDLVHCLKMRFLRFLRQRTKFFWDDRFFSPRLTQKWLEVDPILGFKYSHLNISGLMHYKKMMSLELLFVLLCSRANSGGGATGHAKKAGVAVGPKIWWLYSKIFGKVSLIQKSTSKQHKSLQLLVNLLNLGKTQWFVFFKFVLIFPVPD